MKSRVKMNGAEGCVPEKFSAVTTADELWNFLETRRHVNYHHFTTISALNAILTGRRWKMSPAKRMNDQHECMEKNDSQLRDRLVSASFSFGDEDNMAMWVMYGFQWEEGVRITIPGAAMRDWYRDLLRDRRWRKAENVESISLHDIAYYQGRVNSGEAYLRWARGKCLAMLDHGMDVAESSRFTGYIKNSAWKQESEARLVVTLKEKADNDFYIPVPESVLKRFKICIGPMTVGDVDVLKSKILKGVKPRDLRDALSAQTTECFFRGRVDLKR